MQGTSLGIFGRKKEKKKERKNSNCRQNSYRFHSD